MIDFSIHPVHPILKPYIRLYSIMQLKPGDSCDTLFTAETEGGLLFFFGEEESTMTYDFFNNQKKTYIFDKRQLWLCGMHNEPIKGQFGTTVNVLCPICTPKGIHYLLQDNANTALNKGFSFEALGLSKKFDGLSEQLHEAKNKEEVLKLAESYLINYFSGIDIPFSIKDISPVAEYISRKKGMVQVNELEDKFRISRRWIEKQFATANSNRVPVHSNRAFINLNFAKANSIRASINSNGAFIHLNRAFAAY